jgi:Flp pilus assembly protein protease CpaA
MIALGLVGIGVGLLALVVASLFDIKTREVPDWLSYSLLAFALGASLIMSIYFSDFTALLDSFLGFLVGLAIGLLMFYTGQWGGGDSKLIMGLSALLGFSFSEFEGGFPLLIVFMMNMLLVGAVYGVVMSMIKALTNLKNFREAAEKRLKSKQVLVIRVVLLVICLGAFFFLLFTKSTESFILFAFALSLFLFFYFWVFISTVEKTCMIKKMAVKQLTEGDWLAEDVKKSKKVIVKVSRIGLTLDELAALKKNRIKEAVIKVGIPFVPSFLMAYVITLAVGDWLFLILSI